MQLTIHVRMIVPWQPGLCSVAQRQRAAARAACALIRSIIRSPPQQDGKTTYCDQTSWGQLWWW